MHYAEYWVYRMGGFEVIRVTRSLIEEKRWPPWPKYFPELSEKLMQARDYHYYAVFWILSISDKRLWSYQGDKVLIWRKKNKDGCHDPNIFPNLLKNWYSLGINTCIQYVEHQMNWKSSFVDIRVTWMRGGVYARRHETVQKLKASPW